MQVWDAIVLGTGGVGSAALYHLAARGARVLGLDAFGPAHARGSSHGQSRIIRRAYFEHPNYVPLVERALALWQALETEAAARLFEPVGLLQVGPAEGAVLGGVRASAERHGLTIESLSATQIQRRWPGFQVPNRWQGLFEPGAGLLRVERCVLAHLDAARALGARLQTGETALHWQGTDQGVEVRTERDTYHARRLVMAAGPWAGGLLADLNLDLRVVRKTQIWFRAAAPEYQASAGFPAWLFETGDGVYYGFPALGRPELKAAEHSGGDRVVDPATVDRQLRPEEVARLAAFLSRCLPGVSFQPIAHAVCLYTLSPDEHFVIDHHPRLAQVVFAAGLSGHGFKFASVLGQALAEMALEGGTHLPIAFLGLGRFGASPGESDVS